MHNPCVRSRLALILLCRLSGQLLDNKFGMLNFYATQPNTLGLSHHVADPCQGGRQTIHGCAGALLTFVYICSDKASVDYFEFGILSPLFGFWNARLTMTNCVGPINA
jgi:hypothetical protein